MNEVQQKLHQDIMRSVKIVKRRYYIFGLLTGFFASLLAVLWVVYVKMLEIDSFDFFPVFFSSISNDVTLISDFKEDLVEFLPLGSLGWSLALFIIVCFLIGLIIQYRKVLFLKVGKFKK